MARRVYARAALPGTEPTLDVDRTLGADDAPPTAYAYDELHRGDSVGRYLVLRPLGRGGMGAVYAAHDPELDRTVALKIVHRSGPRGVSLKDEAQTLARLSHPNVVAVHDVGDLPDGVFIAMEYVEGDTLRRWAKTHRDDPQALASVMRDAGKGLAAAHRAGLVHLDFKPDNVMIAADGRVLVLDFGLAQPRERTGGGTDVAPAGTPAYMAPEMHDRKPLDDRADQFSFCVTWIECALGQRPFPGDSPSAIARAILEGEARLPPRPAMMPRALWQALLRGISNDPELRWPSMEALLEAVEPRGRARRQTIVAAAVAGTLGAVGMWVFEAPRTHCTNAAAPVVGAWSEADARAIAARAAELGTPEAKDRAEKTTARLQSYADELSAGYDEACRVDPDNLPRTVCLDARLEQFRATKDAILSTDLGDAGRFVHWDLLPDVAACRRADEEALYRDVSDPEQAKAVLAKLARGTVGLDIGDRNEAITDLHATARDAAALGWRGVEALAHAGLSRAFALEGDEARMEEEYALALAMAAEAGSDQAMFSILSARLQEYALRGDAASVLVLAPIVEAALVRSTSGSPHIVPISVGNARQLTGDYDGAEAAYEEGLAVAPSERDALSIVSNLGALKLYRGKFVEAKEMFEEALPRQALLESPSSISTLKLQANLADAEQQLGLLDEARAHYEDALAKYEAKGAGSDRAAQHLRLNYATLLIASGELDQAAEVGTRAAAKLVEAFGPKHPYSIAARDFENSLALARGEYARVLADGRTLVDDTRAIFGDEVPLLGFLQLNLAKAALALGEHAAGLEALETAEPLLTSLSPQHPMLVSLLSLRAELLLLAGDVAAAMQAAEAAVQRSAADSVSPVDRGRAFFARARTRIAGGETSAEAKSDLEQAIAGFEAMPAHPDGRLEAARALLSPPPR